MDELHRNFNEINYLKLFELLFTNNKQHSMKQENKNNFFRKFFNFLEKNTELAPSKTATTTNNNSNDLESKLEQMKLEIEQLKTTLNNTVQDSKALSFLANDSKSPAKMQAQQQKNFKFHEIPDFNLAAQKTPTSKNAIVEHHQHHLNKNTIVTQTQDLWGYAQAKNEFLVEKLQKDLLDSNEKNRQLERELEDKSKQIEHYGKLFR